MKLTTDYREQAVGALKGSKEYYLVGTVEFTNEERAVAQERGVYDVYVNVPAATAPPTRGGDCLHLLGAAKLMPEDSDVTYDTIPH